MKIPRTLLPCLAACLAACLGASPARAQDKPNYVEHILPLFEQHCNKCHNPDKSKGDVNLASFNALMQGGSSGAIVLPGDPDNSTLYKVMAHLEEPYMPSKGPKRPDAELELVKKWIAGGLLENPGGKALAAVKPKVNLKLAAVPTGKPEGPPPMPRDLLLQPVVRTVKANAVVAMANSPWAPLVAIAGHNQVLVYNTDDLQLGAIFPFPEGEPKDLKFSRNAKLLIAGGGVQGQSGRVVVWDIETGRRIIVLGKDYDAVFAADISPDQSLVVTGGPDKLVKIWSTLDGEPVHRIKKHTEWVTAAGFSPDGVLLATGDRNGGLHVWESETGQSFYALNGHNKMITSVAWRADSNVLASASEDGTIKLWNMHDGNQIKSWNAHGGVLSLNYDNSGNLVSAGRDKRVRVWDGNGAQVKEYPGFGDIALSAVFSHDGKKVIGGDWSGQVLVWNKEDAKQIGSFAPNPPTLDERIASLEKTIKELNDPYQKLVAAANAARGAVTPMQAAFTKASEAEKQVKAKVAEREKQFNEANAKLTASQTAAAAAAKALEDVKKTLSSAQQAATTSQQTVNELNKQIAAMQEQLKVKQAELAKAQAATKTAGDLAAKQQEMVTQRTAELQAAQKLKADNQAKLTAIKAELAAAVKAMTDQKAVLDAAQKKAAEAQAAADKAKPDLAPKQKELARWKAAKFNLQVLEAKKKLAEKQAGIDKLKAQLEAAIADAGNDEAQIKKLTEEYEKLKGQP